MTWLQFHTLRDTPKKRIAAKDIVSDLKCEGINARVVSGKHMRTGGKTVVVEVSGDDWDKVRDLLKE